MRDSTVLSHKDEYIFPEWFLGKYGQKSTLKITCSGMPKSCYDFVTWDNFKTGAVFDGKKNLKTVKGGVILQDVQFAMKDRR